MKRIVQRMSDGKYRFKDVMQKLGGSKFIISPLTEKPLRYADYEVFSDGKSYNFVIKIKGKTVYKSPTYKSQNEMDNALTQQQKKIMKSQGSFK
jgi:hypothetical protein